jgi:hypothetical protein
MKKFEDVEINYNGINLLCIGFYYYQVKSKDRDVPDRPSQFELNNIKYGNISVYDIYASLDQIIPIEEICLKEIEENNIL